MKTVKQMMDLNGKVALVTGAASGIGQGICEGLAEAGADIVGVYHMTPPHNTERMVTGAKRKFVAIYGDLSEKESMKPLFQKALEAFGKIDILVNTAGVYEKMSVEDFDYEKYQKTLEINQNSTLYLSIEASKYFLDFQIHGRIINIISLAGMIGYTEETVAYAVAEHALTGITRSMGLQLAQRGITVNAIVPCLIKTRMTAGNPEVEQANEHLIVMRSPMKRWGHPGELKGIAVLLASEASSFMTGQAIIVDGGYLLR